jgi:hypothetical protein
MFCVVIDDNPQCPGFFMDGQFYFDKPPEGVTATWKMSEHFHAKDIKYVQNYTNGRGAGEVCPQEYREDYSKIQLELMAFKKSLKTSKVEISDCCLFELLPRGFLKDYCTIQQKIGEWVLNNKLEPNNNDFLVDAWGMFNRISKRELKFDKQAALKNISDEKSKRFYQSINDRKNIKYDVYGTITGRLTTKKKSFPILNFDKRFRSTLLPTNDFFLELDINGAELRTMLALLGKEQPKYDIHQWNADNLFGGITREDSKKKFWSWFYNPDYEDEQLESIYSRSELTNDYADGHITTIFGRRIPCDKAHAINYKAQHQI